MYKLVVLMLDKLPGLITSIATIIIAFQNRTLTKAKTDYYFRLKNAEQKQIFRQQRQKKLFTKKHKRS